MVVVMVVVNLGRVVEEAIVQAAMLRGPPPQTTQERTGQDMDG